MPRARILIRNKPGVFDPEGKVVHTGLARLGHASVEAVQVGKVIDLEFAAGSADDLRAEIDEMCQQFLVNPVIENYTVEILED